jgi:hypothetical protein
MIEIQQTSAEDVKHKLFDLPPATLIVIERQGSTPASRFLLQVYFSSQ